MIINMLPWFGLFFVIFCTVVLIILASKNKPLPNTNAHEITSEKIKKYVDISIAIQPDNSLIFQDQTLDEVIKSGVNIMREENFKLMEGVDQDGI